MISSWVSLSFFFTRSFNDFGTFIFLPPFVTPVWGLFGIGPYPDDSPGFLWGESFFTGLAVVGLAFGYLTVLPPFMLLAAGESKKLPLLLIGVLNVDDICCDMYLLNSV